MDYILSHFKVFLFQILFLTKNIFYANTNKNKKPIVLLSGHYLDGNLKAFYDYYFKQSINEYDLYFIGVLKKSTLNINLEISKNILDAKKLKDFRFLLKADCMITSHGNLFLLLKLLNKKVKMIDVWHGTPLIEYKKSQFIRSFYNYDYLFLQSDHLKNKYIETYNLKNVDHVITGLARHDKLFNYKDNSKIKKDLNISNFKKIILFCPTWRMKNDFGEIPFSFNFLEFFEEINIALNGSNALLIARFHQKSRFSNYKIKNLSNIKMLPQSEYLDTEKLMCISDALISDWSSIITDYCFLNKPIILIDCPIPKHWKTKKFFIQRGGTVIKDISDLKKVLKKIINKDLYKIDNTQKYMKNSLSGELFDGKSSYRYHQNLMKILKISDL
tara:strand:- start:742 stop:1902 length:1161 start_codon:yes stop_codon:yes gene_type:complete